MAVPLHTKLITTLALNVLNEKLKDLARCRIRTDRKYGLIVFLLCEN